MKLKKTLVSTTTVIWDGDAQFDGPSKASNEVWDSMMPGKYICPLLEVNYVLVTYSSTQIAEVMLLSMIQPSTTSNKAFSLPPATKPSLCRYFTSYIAL